jgi:hypothetical protein
MSHQPYEIWILSEDQITPQEQEDLRQHLKECPECFELQRSWTKVQTQIKEAPVKPAPSGFVPRWKTQFAIRQKEQESRQARTLLISLTSGAGALTIALAVIMLPDFSLISILVGSLTTLVKLYSGIESIYMVARSIFNSAPTITLVISGLLLAGWISLAAFAWGISIWRINTKRVKNNEN